MTDRSASGCGSSRACSGSTSSRRRARAAYPSRSIGAVERCSRTPGNAGDWLANASAQGLKTAASPTVGAIAVYRPGSGYSALGHVAIVIAVSARAYTISEMYFVGFGEVNTRTIWWPDPHIAGFIPLSQEDMR